MLIDENTIIALLKTKKGFMFHREGQELEYKEQFNFAGLSEYLRDFAGFANNKGGFIIFGIKDSPRRPVGLNDKSKEQFEKIDPAIISEGILDLFSTYIFWDQCLIEIKGKAFGVFKINESEKKPIIAKKNDGDKNLIKNCEIYYRYGGRTQQIQYAELKEILDEKIEENNRAWQDLMTKIAHTGPENAAIINTESGLVSKGDSRLFLIDENLAKKLDFSKKDQGSRTQLTSYKLVENVYPVKTIEREANRLERYPYSATQLAGLIKERLPDVKLNEIWKKIKEHGLKDNEEYSTYSFRNKQQQDNYRLNNVKPKYLPSIYNENALEFLISKFNQEQDLKNTSSKKDSI
jgi:hypothetical protein